MAEKKKQHIIPRCYLRAWCDPTTPSGQHPFIWRISKDGTSKTKRSPEKSFTATDKYTIRLADGQRNLVIENTLAKIEADFVGVLGKVRSREKLSASDRARLCVFTAAMHSRTVSMGEHRKKQMSRLHEVVVDSEQAKNLPAVRSLETAKMVELAHQEAIAASLEHESPLLFQMQMTILMTDDEMGFITSDNPCVWFNPSLHKMPPAYRSPGLGQLAIEVTLPLTPQHALFISHQRTPEYVEVDQALLDESNRLTRFACNEEFVSWKGQTRPSWFERGEEPSDTWEKVEEHRKALRDGSAKIEEPRNE
jgi:Protein of unknown function (DUF4238)